MRAFLAVMSVVLALLLGVIALELHQVNQHLAWVSAPIKGVASLGEPVMVNGRPETREERIARRARDIQESSDEAAEVMRRVLTGAPAAGSAKSRPSPTPASPKVPRP